MSFFSSIRLVANHGVRTPTDLSVRELLVEVGLVEVRFAERNIGNLSESVRRIFEDAAAVTENDRFFRPDTIALSKTIQVMYASVGTYSGRGYSINISGYGYFFPWTLTDIRDRFVRSPPLVRLRTAVERRFGGRFVSPRSKQTFLQSRLIDGDGAWAWFGSESW